MKVAGKLDPLLFLPLKLNKFQLKHKKNLVVTNCEEYVKRSFMNYKHYQCPLLL
jgi:hypothetical protein